MQKKTSPQAISSDVIRKALVDRANAYVSRNRSSFSAIGLAAVNDSKFVSRVANGENFSIRTYQRVMDWLDAAEREMA